MKISKTRRKLFLTCIIFMFTFMILFVAAIQAVNNTAFFEAYSEPKIKEMQELYDIYDDTRDYYEESMELFTSIDYITDQAVNVLKSAGNTSIEQAEADAQKLSSDFFEYMTYMYIYLVDESSIIYLHNDDDSHWAQAVNHDEGQNIEFARPDDVYAFLSQYGVLNQSDTYQSNHVIINSIEGANDIYVIGIPRYDKIFGFCKDEIVIYNKYDQELLRLNSAGIEKGVPTGNIIKVRNFKRYGIGRSRQLVCYYSNKDERGEYVLGEFGGFDFRYRFIIYTVLAVFFLGVSILFWLWSVRITKPLDFFLMWIKLIKDKGTIDEDEKADMPMPKENYYLQNNIMIFFSFCLIPIIIAAGIQWFADNQVLNNKIEQVYVESAEFYGEILDEKFYIFQSPVIILCEDDRMIGSLENYSPSTRNRNILDSYIHEYSKATSDSRDDLTIYDIEGNVVVSSSNDNQKDGYIAHRINIGEDYRWSFADGLDKFALYQKIYSNDDIIGYCKLEIKEPNLHAGTPYDREHLYSCYIYKYTDKIYNLVSSPNLPEEIVINMIRSNEKYNLTQSVMLEKAGINYFYIIKENVFFEKIWTSYVLVFMNVMFFLSIALVFAASITTRSILNPIIHLSNTLYSDSPQIPMSTLLLGREEFALIVNRVKILSERVNLYAEEQKLLEAERHEHEKKRKDAEILTLQTQINPHFMYNIFSSIAVLIRTGQTEKATKMVTYTGNLMRMGLYRGHVMIPLKEEIDHVTQYINIQQIRYNNCMEINMNIDDKLMQYKVVKFILQPIVENAIEHNVGYLGEKILKITIEAYLRGSQLIIRVTDNGKGMDAEHMVRLQRGINNFDMSNHLGLANINERIKLNCGQDYGVILKNNQDSGLRVELKLPIVTAKEE